MFTGIIKSIGVVKTMIKEGSNLKLEISSSISKDLKVDESVSHNGVCLTIIKSNKKSHWVQVIKETLDKTTLSEIKLNDPINLERSIKANELLGGHIVQGHVDTVLEIQEIKQQKGSDEWWIKIKKKYKLLVIPQGSICINGVSLTIADIRPTAIKVCLIPFTLKHTNLQYLKSGDRVNVEFDVFGKYIQRIYQFK